MSNVYVCPRKPRAISDLLRSDESLDDSEGCCAVPV